MSVVSVEKTGDIVWITIDNPPVNATSTAVRKGLLDAVSVAQGARLAVLRGAGKTFVAGGDMREFDRPAEEPHLPDVVAAIETSDTPFLVLLHGNVLGGGFEIAMACTYRIAAPGTRFGLPEVNVGLIPGAGGTQRAPRLLGWDMAADLACLGKTLTAETLLGLGGIDQISEDFDAAVARFDLPRPTPVSERAAPPLDPAWVAARQTALQKRARGQRSPLHNLTALQWAADPFDQGQPRERALHLELRASNESRALRHIFFAERSATRPEVIRNASTCNVSRVAIVGGGLMGAGIATACLLAGLQVDLIERDTEAADAARTRVTGLLDGALKRGKITQPQHDAYCNAFAAHDSYGPAKDADLAIEAVFEDLSAKRTVFEELSANLRPDTLLATNTSYLDPRDIFAGIPGPERCLGLHFFSPAHIMKLVEVIHLPETSPETLATGFALARRLQKIPVLAGICDGFIGNRMLAAYRRAAEYMLADGALPSEIDDAMRAYGMAMGPFEAQDMGGLQIAEANRRRQDATRPKSERYVTIADELCSMGRLGQRVGKGWYTYPDGSRSPKADPEVTALILGYAKAQGIRRETPTPEQIQTQLLAVLANEGARIVEDNIADSEAAVDLVKVHGYGFPRWRGGPMNAAQMLGKDKIRAALEQLETHSPGSWQRAQKYS